MNIDLNELKKEINLAIKLNNPQDTLRICELAEKHFPNEYEIFEIKSEIYYKLSQFDEAFSNLEKVISLMPNEMAPLFRKGRWKLNLGCYKEVVDTMTTVIETKTNYFLDASYYFRALAWFYLAEYENALEDCKYIPNDFSIGPDKMSKSELENQIAGRIKRA